MSKCNEFYPQLILYLDDELDPSDKLAVDAHLKHCQECQQIVARERWFKEYVASAKSLYKAPEDLRTRVASILSTAPITPAVHPFTAAREILFGQERGLFAGVGRKLIATASVLFILLGIWIGMIILVPSEFTTFASVAVDAHQRHQRGQMPLELVTESPDQITDWFNGKTPFPLKLPHYSDYTIQIQSYSLRGATLIPFKKQSAAYVSYLMDGRLISLLVASSDAAKPSGPQMIPSKDLTFYYDTINSLKVITWSHKNLTYALVSDLEERGQQSCMVCHQDTSLQLGFNSDP